MADLERKLSDLQRNALLVLLTNRQGRSKFHHRTTASLLQRALVDLEGDSLTLTFDGREVAATIKQHSTVS